MVFPPHAPQTRLDSKDKDKDRDKDKDGISPNKRKATTAGIAVTPRVTPAGSVTTPRTPCGSPRASPTPQKLLRRALTPEGVAVLRRLSSQATRQALCEASGDKPEEAEARQIRVDRLADRFQQCSGEDGEKSGVEQPPVSDNTARLLTEVARLSAIVAASGASQPKVKQDPRLGTEEAVRVQNQLDQCLEDLRAERDLSAPLLRHLKTLCWNSAWDTARKDNLAQPSEREPGAWKAEDLQRRLNDVRAEVASDEAQSRSTPIPEQTGWRGVNLGGWLLWEPGPANEIPMVQASGDVPQDEWSLCKELRKKLGNAEAEKLVSQHRATYVTKKDFEEIAALGLNSVRIPFGHWLVTGPRAGEPFVGPDFEPLDNAFRWAQETGLQVVLSFHGMVGFQSGHQASGRSDDDWDPSSWDPCASLEVLKRIASRYGTRRCLGGITVVNEPACAIPLKRLLQYYKDAYATIRRSSVPDRVQVIMPVYQRQFSEFKEHFRAKNGFRNVVFDVHIYHLFHESWERMSLASHLRWAAGQGKIHDAKAISSDGEQVIVSEWCLALPTWDFRFPAAWEWSWLTRTERTAVLKSFAQRQLRTFASHSHGWFFWSWKDGEGYQWNLRQAAAKGLLPLNSPSPVLSRSGSSGLSKVGASPAPKQSITTPLKPPASPMPKASKQAA